MNSAMMPGETMQMCDNACGSAARSGGIRCDGCEDMARMGPEDLVVIGIEVEEDIARDAGENGRAAAAGHLRRAIEEIGLAGVLQLVAEAAGGAADMHEGTSGLDGEVVVARHVARRLGAVADLLKA